MNEDWTDMVAAEPLAGEELERILARYARVRLDPSPAQARRARAAVMEQAWRQRIAASPTASSPVTGSRAAAAIRTRRGLFAGWTPRRIGLSLSAAVVAGLMVGSSVFASSRAGGPLYETRLALETITLPADPEARTDARLEQAQTRLAEAVEAAGRRDEPATEAALAAYDATINDLLSAHGAAAARALIAVQMHREILLGIAGSAPDEAAAGIARAIANTDHVIQVLGDAGSSGAGGGSQGGNEPGGNNGGGKPTANPNPTAKPGRTPGPAATQKPARTQDPNATPKPGKTPAPVTTPKPGKTPPPHKTPNPGKPDSGSGGSIRTTPKP